MLEGVRWYFIVTPTLVPAPAFVWLMEISTYLKYPRKIKVFKENQNVNYTGNWPSLGM